MRCLRFLGERARHLVITPMLDPRDEALALPELAIVPVHHFFRDLDRGLVVVCFKPLARRDLIDPVEAIKPVVCHAPTRMLGPPKRQFSPPKRLSGRLVSCPADCQRKEGKMERFPGLYRA